MSAQTVIRNTYRMADRLIAMLSGFKSKITIRFDAPNSCTDGQTINIGKVPVDRPDFITVVPAFAVHEAAHVRWTNFNVLEQKRMDALESRIQNALEDYLIERNALEYCPGVVGYLDSAVEYLIETRGFPSLDKTAPNSPWRILGWLLYRVRGYLGQPMMADMSANGRWEVATAIGEKAVEAIEAMTTESAMRKVSSTSQTVAMAVAIAAIVRAGLEQQAGENREEPPQKGAQGEQSEAADAGADNDSESGEGSEEGAESAGAEGSGNDDGEGSPSNGETSASDGADDSASVGDEASAAGGANGVKEDGSEASASSGDASTADDSAQILADIAADRLTETDVGSLLREVLDGMNESDKKVETGIGAVSCAPGSIAGGGEWGMIPRDVLRSNPAPLSVEIQRLAQMMRTRLHVDSLSSDEVVRSGVRLRGGALYRVGFGSNRIFDRKTDGRTFDTDFVVVCDNSGSMGGHQLLLVEQAARGLSYATDMIQGVRCGVISYGTPTMIRKPLAERYRVADRYLSMGNLGGTYTVEALFAAVKMLVEGGAARKLIVLMTDGQENEQGRTIADARRFMQITGVELITVGIQVNVPKYYGESVRLDSAQEIPETLFGIAADAIWAKGRGRRAA